MAPRTSGGPRFLDPGASAAVIGFDATNQGKSWDRSGELKKLILQWQGGDDGHFLDNDEVNGLFSLLSVFVESDGEPGWDPVGDTLVASFFPISVDSRDYAELTLASSLPNPELPPGFPVRYYLVLQQRADALSQPVQRWYLRMEDYVFFCGHAFAYRDFDSPLIAGPTYWLGSGWVKVTPEDLLFHDEFESGDVSAWSAAVGGS